MKENPLDAGVAHNESGGRRTGAPTCSPVFEQEQTEGTEFTVSPRNPKRYRAIALQADIHSRCEN